MVRRILYSLALACLLVAILLLALSFYNPGRFYYLDIVRMPIQSRIMSTAGDILVGDYFMPVEAVVPSPNALLTEDILPLLQQLQPGDIFFTNSEKFVSSRLTPGKWKHAGIYLGTREQVMEFFHHQPEWIPLLEAFYLTGNEHLILDSSNEGVTTREFTQLSNLGSVSLLIGLSAFRINRDREGVTAFVNYALDQLGKPYDYDLLLDDSRAVYCSELVYHGLYRIGIELSVTEQVYGREVITPNTAVDYIIRQGIPAGEFNMVLYLEKENGLLVFREGGKD